MTALGPLVAADEALNHQITDTFATVGQSDRSWTEKICAMACARDGSLQLAFGLGKYPNRNVMDGYAGVSRGVEQWTVRASRALGSDPGTASAGPLHYEVLDPLRTVRFALDENDVVPIRFEWIFEQAVPPFLEQREIHRSSDGARLDADIVRYHQIGSAYGWAEVDGERVEFDGATWASTRDHSWGVRYMVGAPVGDVEPRPTPAGVSTTVIWSPVLCERPDRSRYALHTYYQQHRLGDWQRVEMQGGVEHPDGRKEHFAGLVPELEVRDDNRRFQHGSFRYLMADGGDRLVEVKAASDTGFHLGAGLYFGFDEQWHGQWRGPLVVDGEYVADCTEPATSRRLHQFRDCVVHIDDPTGGGTGWGNLQSLFVGPNPDVGLTEDASFM
ncbi:MAG: hypothetical protein ACRDWD_15370 [Acidimicrobiia bacterium]